MTTKLSQESMESSRRTFFGRTLASAGAAVMATALTTDRTLGQEYGVLPQGSQRIVMASQAGAKLDSNVETGGGTDDTHVLQAVLEKAVEWGSLHLIMDGAALTAGLRVHANTTIECLNQACGFFHKANTNQPVLTNANPRYVGERIDKNIMLLGGTYNNNNNNNCRDQVHHYDVDEAAQVSTPECFGKTRWNITLEFLGVENFTMRDVTIRDQRTFAMLMANFYRVTCEDI